MKPTQREIEAWKLWAEDVRQHPEAHSIMLAADFIIILAKEVERLSAELAEERFVDDQLDSLRYALSGLNKEASK